MDQPKQQTILIAEIPGFTINVPADDYEPVQFIMDRVTNKLVNTEVGNSFWNSIYLDGEIIEDGEKSMQYYKLFGRTLTYKSNFAADPSQAIQFDNKVKLVPGHRKLIMNGKIILVNIVTAHGTHKNILISRHDTVSNVKKTILYQATERKEASSCKMVPKAKEQQFQLYFNGLQMKDNHIIDHYDVGNCDTFYLLRSTKDINDSSKKQNIRDTKKPKSIQGFVVTLDGGTISFNLRANQTIRELKQVICDKEDIPIEEQILVYSAKVLLNNKTLATYNITNGATIHLSLRLSGGHSLSMRKFADVSDRSSRLTCKLGDHAPPGCIVTSGINIELQCKCTDYKVTYPHGYSRFELGDTLTPCPNCGDSTDVTPITVGFLRCHYRIFGIKHNGSTYKSDWYRVLPKDQYQMYDPKQQVSWRRLGFEARPLTASTNEPCIICLEIMDDDEDIVTLECSHQFHTKCISSWHLTCPICRAGSSGSL